MKLSHLFSRRTVPVGVRSRKYCLHRVVSLLISAWLASACSSGPAPKLYLLESASTLEATTRTQTPSPLGSLGMVGVSLPGYTVGTQIASREASGVVSQAIAHRWAEEPAEAINRLLTQRLREQAGTTVLKEPWPRDYNPTVRIQVVFDLLLRDVNGGAGMAGQILLLSGDGRKLLRSIPFNANIAGQSSAWQSFFVAVSQGIDDIARTAVQALQEMKIKS